MRDTFEGRLEWIGAEARAQAAKTQAAWAERAEASRADIERVEACTLAALEKLASDHAALARRSEDLAAQINDLRLDFEQTVLGIEQRSVRALEQIGQTVSVLEQRFAEAESPSARSA